MAGNHNLAPEAADAAAAMSAPSANPSIGVDPILEDADFVALAKPAGLVSEPGLGHRHDSLMNGAMARWGERLRPLGEARDHGLLHRLDRDTSGVMVLATDAETHRRLSMAFEARQVAKAYHALVAGHVTQAQGFIDLPIRKEALGSARQVICQEQGRPSQTRWTLETRLPCVPAPVRGPGGDPFPCSLLRLEPLTGRSHQLRVHLLSIGHPILGDNLYGSEFTLAAATRLCLHASELGFEGSLFRTPHAFQD